MRVSTPPRWAEFGKVYCGCFAPLLLPFCEKEFINCWFQVSISDPGFIGRQTLGRFFCGKFLPLFIKIEILIQFFVLVSVEIKLIQNESNTPNLKAWNLMSDACIFNQKFKANKRKHKSHY